MKRIHPSNQLLNFSFLYLTHRGIPLSDFEKVHFYDCVRKINLRNKTFLFRGENILSLSRIYGIPPDELKEGLFDKIFILGGKGRYFESPRGHEGVEIGEYSKNQFYLIFKMLHTLFTKNFDGNKGRFMRAFKIREIELSCYFSSSSNVTDFQTKMTALPTKEKIQARDYYLTLLHNLDKSEFYSQSFFLSTTTNLKKAENFAGMRNEHFNEESIIFVGWLPYTKNILLHAPSPNDFSRMLRLLNVQLPIYKKLIFYNQHEIALKGGLLPHYMLGYQYSKNDKTHFEVNPAIFQTDKEWNGEELPVDQGDFISLLKSTSFSRFFTIDENTGFYHAFGTDDYHFDWYKIC